MSDSRDKPCDSLASSTAEAPQSRRQRLHLLLLLVSLLPLYLIEITWGLPNYNCVWGYDCNPLEPLISVKRIFLDGWNTGYHDAYPRFHHYLVALPQGLYMAIQYGLGNLNGLDLDAGYPYGVENFDAIFMHLALIIRLISALMALGTIYWTYQIGRSLFSHQAGLFGGAMVGLAPILVYYAHTETLDVPMLFWLSAALHCYVRACQTLRLRYYVWLAILAAVSTATKDYAYGAFLLMPLPLVWQLARHLTPAAPVKSISRALVDRRHWIALAVFLVAFAVAENWIWNLSGFANHVVFAGGLAANESGTVITTTLGRHDVLSVARLVQLCGVLFVVLGWVSFPVCCLGAAVMFCRSPRASGLLFWPLVSYYVCSPLQYLPPDSRIDRPFIPVALMLAIPGGGFLAVVAGSRLSRTLKWGAVGLVMLAAAIGGLAMTVALARDTRYQAEAWIAAHVPKGSTVEMYGYRRDLPRSIPGFVTKVVNHKSGNEWSDVPFDELFVSEQWIAELETRSPEIVVVSHSYSDDFTGTPHTTKHRRLASFPRIAEFFGRLGDGAAPYVPVARFEPKLARTLGFGDHIVPEIDIYERQASDGR